MELFLGSVTSLATFALTALFVRWERLPLGGSGSMPDGGSLSRLAFGFLVGLMIITTWAAISLAAGQVRWVASSELLLASVGKQMRYFLPSEARRVRPTRARFDTAIESPRGPFSGMPSTRMRP
jgi:hypothetical protein